MAPGGGVPALRADVGKQPAGSAVGMDHAAPRISHGAYVEPTGQFRHETTQDFGPAENERSTIDLMAGTFFHGDNLEVLRVWFPDECVDLIYLDPPFNSDQDFNLPFGADEARPVQKKRGFTDTWQWDDAAIDAYTQVTKTRAVSMPDKLPGLMRSLYDFLYPKYRHVMLAYLANMAVRLVELRRVMKPKASLYLHCDPTAGHYLKMILDSIFGIENFRSEIVWKRSYGHGNAKKYAPVHDLLLFYSRSAEFTWNPAWQRMPQKTLDEWYNNYDPPGPPDGRRFNRDNLTGSGTRGGESGMPWRGIDVTKKGRHWAIPRSVEMVKEIVGDLGTHEALDALDAAGRIHWPDKEDGVPMFKRYIEEAAGVPALDVITNIPQLHNVSPERVGYPTQKPLALLKHILELSTNVGDLVFDPFCGCGTSIIASEQIDRRWLGIDIGDEAITTLKEKRIPREAPDAKIREEIEPFDIESARLLAKLDEYKFQWWAVRKLGGQPPDGKMKKGSDRGKDGEIFIETTDEFQRRHRVIISVKSGEKQAVSMVNELSAAVNNPEHKAHMGVLVTLEEPKRNLRDRAREFRTVPGSADGKNDPDKIQVVSAADLLARGPACVTLPGRNVTPLWRPVLPIPERIDQVPLPVDQKPQKDRRRAAALVADNTRKGRKPRTGPVKVAPHTAAVEPKQTVMSGSGGSFRLTSGRKK